MVDPRIYWPRDEQIHQCILTQWIQLKSLLERGRYTFLSGVAHIIPLSDVICVVIIAIINQ